MTKRNIFKRAASLLLALIIVFSAGVSLAFADANISVQGVQTR